MFLVTSLFYFIPVMGLIGYVYTEVFTQIPQSKKSTIGFLSIGAFIYDPVTPDGIRYFAVT